MWLTTKHIIEGTFSERQCPTYPEQWVDSECQQIPDSTKWKPSKQGEDKQYKSGPHGRLKG